MRAPGLTNTDRLLLISFSYVTFSATSIQSNLYHTIIRSVIIVNYNNNETRETKKLSFFTLLHFHRKGLVF